VLIDIRQPALSVQIIDVATSMSNFTAPSPAINVTVRLDPRGHLSIANAVLVSNMTDSASSGVAGALKGLFGKKDKEDVKDDAGVDAETDSEEATSEASSSSKTQKVAVRFRERQLGVKHMTGEEKRTTLAR
jgi:hypoxia up-regulated 1